jgi:hypothetical protein
MSIDKVVDGLNLPKQVLDKSAAFLNRLLGPAVDEAAQLVADKIRFRRFRNQLRVLQRAEKSSRRPGSRPATLASGL